MDGGINRFCPKLALLTHRVSGESPEAFGRMAEHFCRTLRSLAEGLDSAAECFESTFGLLNRHLLKSLEALLPGHE